MSESNRRKLLALQEENKQFKDLLFAIVRDQGRIRLPKATLESIHPKDQIECRVTEDELAVVLTLKPGFDA